MNRLETTISGKRLELFYGTAAADYTRLVYNGNEIEDSQLFTRLYKQKLLGFQTTKTLTAEPRKGNPDPRFAFTDKEQGLQSMGLPNVGIYKYPFDCNMPTIVSYTAKNLEEAKSMTEYLNEIAKEEPNIFALEYNVACPNVAGCPSCYKEDSLDHLKIVRQDTELPIFAKIGYFPEEDRLVEFGKKLEDIGINGVTAVNSPPGMGIDVRSRKTITAKRYAGVFGKCLKPLGTRTINILHENTDLDLIGLGGISNHLDAIEYIMAGAKAVEFCSRLIDILIGPEYERYDGGDIVQFYWRPLLDLFKCDVENFMKRNGIDSLAEIVGKIET